MGWSNCGEDSQGRSIGYANSATCDHEGCNKKIDRGLSYACGDMHGETEHGCEKYFCEEHLSAIVSEGGEDDCFYHICGGCKSVLLETGEWIEDSNDGVIIPKSEDEQTYTFTFGFGHVDKNGDSISSRYAQVSGTYESARQAVVNARGNKWSFQYEDESLACITQFNLTPISLEDAYLPEDMRGNHD